MSVSIDAGKGIPPDNSFPKWVGFVEEKNNNKLYLEVRWLRLSTYPETRNILGKLFKREARVMP